MYLTSRSFTSQSKTFIHELRSMLAGLLALSLLLFVAGCGGSGANGEGDGDGDGDGDGGETVVPAAPSGLSATPGDGAVDLTWEAAEDAESYNVYRGTSSGVDASGSALMEGVSGTDYTDESVENGTTYYYVVTGVADEEGDPSGEAQGTPFAAPSELAGTSGDSQIELDWSGGAGAETYNVYRSTSSTDGASGDPLKTGITETSYTDEGAENGTTYYYRVTSVSPEDEESSASNEIEKTPFDDPPDRP